jgi:hypothetical protein
MSSARTGRAIKTPNDRAQYAQSVASPQDNQSPTYEEALVKFDTTVSELKEDSKKDNQYQPSSVRPESAITRFIRDKWIEMLLMAFVSAILLQMYSLNREAGELKVKLEQTEKTIEKMEKDNEKLEERLQKEIDRIQENANQITQSPQK